MAGAATGGVLGTALMASNMSDVSRMKTIAPNTGVVAGMTAAGGIGGAVAGAFLTILVSNTYNGTYIPYSPTVNNLDLTAESNLIVYDQIMPVRYMKLQYVAGTTTGQISFTITK